MQLTRLRHLGSGPRLRGWSRAPILLWLLPLLTRAPVASASWGEDWGAMSWGSAVPMVPLTGVPGAIVLTLLCIGLGLVLLRRSGVSKVLLVSIFLLGVPLAAYAATISLPYVFSNGTTADANQVNANFATVVTESNAQDLRITALESGAGHTHPGSDITSQVDDADTVDGVHASALEESSEIDADIAAHAALPSAHHSRFTAAEAFVAAAGVDAGSLDGIDSTGFATSSHSHSGYLATSGGVLTGPLAADNNDVGPAFRGVGTVGPPSNGYLGVQGGDGFRWRDDGGLERP